MADKHTQESRAHRYEKKRKSTILMNWLVGAGSALLVVFLALMIFGGDDQASNAKGSNEENAVSNSEADQEDKTEQDNNSDSSVNDQENTQDSEEDKSNSSESSSSSSSEEDSNEEDASNEESSNEDESSEEEDEVEVEESNEENVAKIVKKDWEPVPTELDTSGEHRISYDKGSQDWNELIQAVSKATGLSKENMITWWVGNGGSPQKAEATVSNKNETEHYRVSVQWVEGEGYKPVKLEVLEGKEVDR
ncbi:YrrS family protein [Halobacillus sp. K22]|uniref:YrrS family protein n=1 Tax=Halobacillus sp. K22 TaxID=3457431 RepID=UPI003FCEE639